MALTEERRGQIALEIVKARFRKDGLRLSSSARRELGAMASDIGVSLTELEEFLFDLLPELVGEAFGFTEVSITTKGRIPIPASAKAGTGDRDDFR